MLARKVEVGLKFECDKTTFDKFVSEQLIKDMFTLNVIELEDGRFSIYVDKKRENVEIKWF